MLSTIEYLRDWVLPFVVVLSVLVFVHELGHYLVARWCRVRVEVFSIGFGPELWGWSDRARTRWKVSAVPLGGYVKMFGENDAGEGDGAETMSAADRAVSFHHKPLRQRAAIVAAGPAANFLFAVVLFAILFSAVGIPSPRTVVGEVQPDSAAAEAGFAVGDEIVSIEDEPVERFDDVRRIVSGRADTPTVFEVRRGADTVRLIAVPRRSTVTAADGREQTAGLLGIKADQSQVIYQRLNPAAAAVTAVERTAAITGQICVALWEMITGSRTASELGGPLRIAQLSGQMAQHGIVNLIFFAAVLSINLGLINLLPIPMLDGGHLAFYGAEAIRGRPVDKRVQEYGFRVGLALVLLLIVFATWNDLVNLKVFDFVRHLVG